MFFTKVYNVKYFGMVNPMLDTLHKEGFLKKFHFGSCNATTPQQQVALDDILAQMDKIESENPTPSSK